MKTAICIFAMALQGSPALSQSLEDVVASQEKNPFSVVGGGLTFGVARVSQPGEFTAFGPVIGFGGAAKIENTGGSPLYLEWNSSLLRAADHSADTIFQGSEPLVYTTRVSPTGTIDLSTLVNAAGAASDATVQIIDNTGDTASIVSSAFSPSGPGTAISQFATSMTASGGIFTALTTNGETASAAAYGSMFDSAGFSFVGIGDKSRTTITTSIEEKIKSFNHAVFLSTRFPISDQWTVTPKIGPTYRSFDRSTARHTSFNIHEGFDFATTIPEISVADTSSLKSTYHGAIFGVGLTRQIRNNWSVNLGAEAGLAKFKARSETFETISFAGNTAVVPGLKRSLQGTARIGRITGGLTHVAPNGAIINLGGFLDYMSDVPYLRFETANDPALSAGGSTVKLVGRGETYQTHSIRKRSIVTSGISLSIVFVF